LLAGLLAVTACSGPGSGKTAAPRRGGVLRIGLPRPASLDPAQARTPEDQLLARMLFATMTTVDPGTAEPRPQIAASWSASADQRHWTFTLGAGRFSDGRPIAASDVVATLARIAKPGSTSAGAELLAPLSGYTAYHSGVTPMLSGVTADGATLVRIDLDQPLSVLPALLASPVFSIVPADTPPSDGTRPGPLPASSGPFSVAGVQPAQPADGLHLIRSPGSAAVLDGIDVTFFSDLNASYKAFESGVVDWSRVPAEQVDAAAHRYGTGGFRPYLAELFYGFNVRSAAFADVRFREVIVRAVDRRAILRMVYRAAAVGLDGIVVAGLPGHLDDACGSRCSFSPDAARSLLATVFPAGTAIPQVPIDFDDNPTQGAVARLIQANLATVGVTAVLRPHPIADYPGFAVTGEPGLFRLGWLGAYPAEEAFLGPLFGSASSSNLTGLMSPAVDAALAAARSEPDRQRRVESYQAAEKAVMAQLPVMPIAQFELAAVVGTRVRGITPAVTGTFDPAGVWLAPAK
jgi:ABC-type transport system substrate-binding protein